MNIVIIGNGVAGTNAARFIRKWSDHKITMISGESEHPYSRTALMYIYMGHMKYENTKLYEDHFWAKNRIELISKWVKTIDMASKSLVFQDNTTLKYDKLIIATGSKSNKFGWPGQDLIGVQGLYNLMDLKSMEEATTRGIKRAVIIGGGLIGIEMAEMFASRNIPVTMLVREESFWDIVLPKEESTMVNEHIKAHHIDLRLTTELDTILDDGSGHVKGITTKSGETIDCEFVGLTVGVSPNIDPFKGLGFTTNRGIVVDEYLQTSNKDIYSIGDCSEHTNPNPGRRPIESIWYTGRMMGQTVARTLCTTPTKYKPGIWFNSAKFLDIEYQVYGDIFTKPEDHTDELYWQHPTENKSIRIAYDKNNQTIVGFNLMGVRYRHEVCEKWLASKSNLKQVLENLSLANFDPEFFKEYEQDLITIYNQKTGSNLKLKSKRNLNLVTRFLQAIN